MTPLFIIGGYLIGLAVALLIAGWHWGRYERDPSDEPVGHIMGAVFWPIPLIIYLSMPVLALVLWPFAKLFFIASGDNENISRIMIKGFLAELGFGESESENAP
jgi:hypothetical protein